ncbi:MAG: hypothetical protein AB7D96_08295 [Arcobacteraceae bacterium]
MRKVTLALITAGVLAGALYANSNHMGDHMHDGKMMNHSTVEGKSTQAMAMMNPQECKKMHSKFHQETKTEQSSVQDPRMKLLDELYAPEEFSG